jgi:NitT/TauT family transport system permease protein
VVRGFIILQLLISVFGSIALVKPYSANFLIKQFCAVLFALAFFIAEFLAYLERRVACYAARRSV